jgi:hypothetical protein
VNIGLLFLPLQRLGRIAGTARKFLQPMRPMQRKVVTDGGGTTYTHRRAHAPEGEPLAASALLHANVLQGLISPQELLAAEQQGTPWLWQGYLARPAAFKARRRSRCWPGG